MAQKPSGELFNRELSLIKFNRRVLAMAQNLNVPLLERLRYICIVSSNLDEFFEVRVATIKQQQLENPNRVGVEGMMPHEVFEQIQKDVHQLVDTQYHILNKEILPALREHDVFVFRTADYTPEITKWAHEVFLNEIMPVLTPIGLDPSHPFPRVYNKSLNFIVSVEGKDAFGREASIAIVQAPRVLPRLIAIPEEVCGIKHGYTLLSSFLQQFVYELFPGMQVKGLFQWRVTRNSDLYLDEDDVTDLRKALQGELSQRNFGSAVRLEIDSRVTDELKHFLQKEFGLTDADTYLTDGSVNLTRFSPLCDINVGPGFVFESFQADYPKVLDVGGEPSAMFDVIRKQDILLHHPYQSFKPVLEFLRAAALDPDVLSIKQTIYRTGEESELMRILLNAAKSGKEVTVIVELLARFDEQTNINWAAKLESVGAHVVYGVVGHKTHAKMALVLRRENNKLVRYGHLGTGNYHAKTARLYTDFGLLTVAPDITSDMDKTFNLLTGLGARRPLQTLLQSPFTMWQKLVELIYDEAENARNGKKAVIMAKMNSLLEPMIIDALYHASQAGVQIELVVRGICTLKPGVPGLSENIHVRSIVGRFLEHSRVFYFYRDGEERLYLSSADWMDRNFFRRVEVAFPVRDPKLKKRVIYEAFTAALEDNQLAWQEQPDGTYKRVECAEGEEPFNIHEKLLQRFE
ncbi:polyphosphate kinase 1 [Brackiella oedipodis]|uniref:polyphosphate kinase 1 n=1 Tax=Brackiella oedipodis TaxID=124225 RepID=UPI00048AB68A